MYCCFCANVKLVTAIWWGEAGIPCSVSGCLWWGATTIRSYGFSHQRASNVGQCDCILFLHALLHWIVALHNVSFVTQR
jgi:hypothetical protein